MTEGQTIAAFALTGWPPIPKPLPPPPPAPAPIIVAEYVSVEDYEEALILLELFRPKKLTAVGKIWLDHIHAHLCAKLNSYLREGLLLPAPSSEQHALSVMHTIGEELAHAAQALESAAYALKERGGGIHASRVKQAATRAREAAEGVLGR